MAVVIVKNKLSEKDFQEAKKDYQSYIKLTIDIEQEIIALGGEYHADAEKILLEQGSKQGDIWGGGLNLETKQLEANAIINIRPGRNESAEILEPKIREKFFEIAKKFLGKYVK